MIRPNQAPQPKGNEDHGNARAASQSDGSSGGDRLHTKLEQRSRSFSNNGISLVSTVQKIAIEFDFPIGIERVTHDAWYKPIGLERIENASAKELLDAATHQISGYKWRIEDGVVIVYVEGGGFHPDPFARRISRFEVRGVTLSEAERLLRELLGDVDQEARGARSRAGIIGSKSPSPSHNAARFDFAAREATLRQVLNGIVAHHGHAAWMVERDDRIDTGGPDWYLIELPQLAPPPPPPPREVPSSFPRSFR